MFDLDVFRDALTKADLSGAIVTTPENFYFVTGCFPKSLLTRSTGAEAVIIPADPAREPMVVIAEHDAESYGDRLPYRGIRTYETWIYFEKEHGGSRQQASKPEQYDSCTVIAAAAAEAGLAEGRIGVEEDLVSAGTLNRIRTSLPRATPVNATRLLYDMRSLKTGEEIARFRRAGAVTERATLASLALATEGATDRELAREFKRVAVAEGAWVAGHCGHVNFSCGPDAGAAHVAGPFPPSVLRAGGVLRLDVGILYEGIVTDFARAFVLGEASGRLRKLHEVLLRANRKMVGSIRPGIRFCDLFRIGIETVREQYPQYSRGHMGHSISLGPNPEEPPFISARETSEVREGMVLCVEAPLYILGYGGMNIEDMVAVTPEGVEELTHMHRGLAIPAQ